MTNSQGSGPTRMMNDDYKAKGSQPDIDPISEGFGMDGWMAGWMGRGKRTGAKQHFKSSNSNMWSNNNNFIVLTKAAESCLSHSWAAFKNKSQGEHGLSPGFLMETEETVATVETVEARRHPAKPGPAGPPG